MLKNAAIAICVTACVATSAFAQERKDFQVFRDISERVNRYTSATIFDNVEANVTDGHVVMTGAVTMPHKRDDIERVSAMVAGKASVENQIEVLPVSTWDDELRFRIARAIYGNSSFWNYAAMANPPIHTWSSADTSRSSAPSTTTSSACSRGRWRPAWRVHVKNEPARR